MTCTFPSKTALLAFTVLLARTVSTFGETPKSSAHAFVFKETTQETGLAPAVGGTRGHAAAWGDVDGSGYPSLFVGTFHEEGSVPSLFFRNNKGHFDASDKDMLHLSSCASGGIFVDLTNNGHLDLYVSNNAHGKDGDGPKGAPSALFRNDGKGKFTDVSKDSGACPPGVLGRTVAAIDYDGDGLLDLVVTDFYYSPKSEKGLLLLHNKGDYHFEDVTASVGLPLGASTAGVAVADFNGDSWPDLILVGATGNNRIYLNDGHGKFKEAEGVREVLAWKNLPSTDFPTGVCVADINRDGLPDVVIGSHFKAPWKKPVSLRVYLNKGLKGGSPTFEEITAAAGFAPLTMKSPQVEIQDFDNDGWPDIFTSIVKFDGKTPYPLIYKNLGVKNGIPQFHEDAWSVNDWPTAADTPKGGTKEFYQRMIDGHKILYSAAAPTADYDRDGKIDIFFANWWLEYPSPLLHNETPGGNWLEIQVQGSGKVNRMGIGSVVNLYRPGKVGDKASLLGTREIAIGYGWCSGQEAVAHFGLGKEAQADVEVILPHGNGKVVKQGVKAGQRLTITK